MLLHDYYPEETRVASEARAAVAAGFEVDVLALRGQGEAEREILDDVQVIRLPVEHRHGGAALALLAEYLRFTALGILHTAARSARRRYDVVQVHNPPDFLVAAALLPRLAGSKVLFDVHDLTPDMFAMRFGSRAGGIADRGLRLVERLSARVSDAVVTVHEPYRAELAAHGVPAEKIAVVMNSLDESVLTPVDGSGQGADGFKIVYHGTVTPHYGVGLLIDAAALAHRSIPGLSVEIYGAGDAIADVVERVRTHRLDDAVTIVPRFLPHDEVLAAIRGASVGVAANLPTRLNRFALPTKLLEYAAMGIPAVAPDLPTIRGHFSDGEVAFFEAGNAASLAHALERVAADPEGAARRAEAARRRYESYRWEHNARTYVELLTRLARKRRRGLTIQPATAAS
jgi:glycosyltransferase involved in cell wall biosynthesis